MAHAKARWAVQETYLGIGVGCRGGVGLGNVDRGRDDEESSSCG